MRTPHNLNPKQKQTSTGVLSKPEQKRLELALKRETSKNSSLVKELGKIESEHKRLTKQYHKTLDELRIKKAENSELLEQLERANKQLAWFKKQFFGQKTEANLPLNVDHDDPADDDSGEEKIRRSTLNHENEVNSQVPRGTVELTGAICRKMTPKSSTWQKNAAPIVTRNMPRYPVLTIRHWQRLNHKSSFV